MALNVTMQGPTSAEESKGPALVMMHFLGGSTREWDEVVALLGPEYRTLRIDLPGFGGSAGETGYSVGEMADAVHVAIATAGLEEYVLVGHSMSGKVSMVLARRAQDAGYRGAEHCGLRGLVLVAPSPPSPEPMSEEKRSSMLGSLGGAPGRGRFCQGAQVHHAQRRARHPAGGRGARRQRSAAHEPHRLGGLGAGWIEGRLG